MVATTKSFMQGYEDDMEANAMQIGLTGVIAGGAAYLLRSKAMVKIGLSAGGMSAVTVGGIAMVGAVAACCMPKPWDVKIPEFYSVGGAAAAAAGLSAYRAGVSSVIPVLQTRGLWEIALLAGASHWVANKGPAYIKKKGWLQMN